MEFLFEPSVRDLSLRCDINCDNRITPADAAIAQRFNAADISVDGQVTSLDVPRILQMTEVPT
ncbi:MAG: hypothetical protein U9Q37_06850 [Euryarchaeota archaeon]|nr:hypothetical protein [Euryarchaeota archaeon]